MTDVSSESGDGPEPPPDTLRTASAAESVTELLADAEEGSAEAWNRIYALLYRDLHRIARSQIRQRLQPGLSATSLVSESWLRLARARASATCGPHLVSLIVRAMRYVLLDAARRELADKRGGKVRVVPLSEVDEPGMTSSLEEMLALNEALESLALADERLAKVVEMRYFGGMDEVEMADVLGVTVRTVRRDWRKARAYLQSHLDGALPLV